MAEYLSPGVYVEEFDSGPKAMEGVSTSTAGFIGLARRGPVTGKPVLITGISQFRSVFGGYLDAAVKYRHLAYGIDQFFTNGGSCCYVMRVASASDTTASMELEQDGVALHLKAGSVGAWGNEVRVTMQKQRLIKTNILEEARDEQKRIVRVKSISGYEAGDLVELVSGDGKEYNRIVSVREGELELERSFTLPYVDNNLLPSIFLHRIGFILQAECDGMVETYNVTWNTAAADFVNRVMTKGILLQGTFTIEEETVEKLEAWLSQFQLNDALYTGFLKDGKTVVEEGAELFLGEDKGPGKRSGLEAFKEVDDVSIMAIPGVTIPAVQSALVAHCEALANRFAILDMPYDTRSVDDMQTHRSYFDSNYGAIYHPWLQIYDPLLRTSGFFPPSAAMAGIYARTDNTRGVFKAPANEVVRGCTGLSVNYNEAEQGKVNPKGINLIRSLPGQGIRVWGARTMSSDASWKYINVRRLFIYVEESIRTNTSWAVFEPNDANLWMRVEGTIHMFLNTLWRSGALVGSSEDEAFFINIGPSTMTQDDILNGRLVCVIGIAPVRPAEFVIFRITQKMQELS